MGTEFDDMNVLKEYDQYLIAYGPISPSKFLDHHCSVPSLQNRVDLEETLTNYFLTSLDQIAPRDHRVFNVNESVDNFDLEEVFERGDSHSFIALDSAIIKTPRLVKIVPTNSRLNSEIVHENILESLHQKEVFEDLSICCLKYEKQLTLRDSLLSKKIKNDRLNSLEQKSESSLEQPAFRPEELTIQQLISIAENIASALKELHDQEVYVDWIAPSHVFIDESGVAKLGKVSSGRGQCPNLNPYLGHGESQQDGTTDIHSFGILFYHLLTGKLPFDFVIDEKGFRYLNPRKSPAIGVEDCPSPFRDFAKVISHCLDLNPQNRPTAGQLLACLRKVKNRNSKKVSSYLLPFILAIVAVASLTLPFLLFTHHPANERISAADQYLIKGDFVTAMGLYEEALRLETSEPQKRVLMFRCINALIQGKSSN